jgi:uncharacterized membrane protein HdeD (DUF308 family)
MSTFADTAFGKEVRKEASHLMWLGAALVAVGVAALVFPLITTLVATLFVGWLLIITGFMTLYVAFSIRGAGPFFGALLTALLSIAAGAFIVARPATGALAITICLGALFMVQGAFEAALAFEFRPTRGWGWMLLSALASVVLSIIIISGLPAVSLITLGILIGVNFISSGVGYMFIGGTTKREAKV